MDSDADDICGLLDVLVHSNASEHPFQTTYQALLAEGLDQKSDGSCIQDLRPNAFVRKSRNEDDRC